MSPPGWRREIEYRLLRWQARLDTRSADRVLPWFYAAVIAVVLGALSLARYRSLENGVELGRYVQGAWLLAEGQEPVTSLSGEHLFSSQTPLIFWPISILTRYVPTAPTLLIIQAIALAVAVVPLYILARQVANLRVGASSALVLVYALYPAVHDLNLADFHPEALAIAPMIGMALASLSGHWWRYWTFMLAVLMCRADFGVAVAGWGIFLTLRSERRQGLLTVSAGIAWIVAALGFVHPALDETGVSVVASLEEYGDTPFGVLWGMLSSPLTVLGDVFGRGNFTDLAVLFAPLLFLPLVAMRYFLPIVPLWFVYLAADVDEGPFGAPHLSVPAIAFLFVAATFGLAKAGTLGVERITVNRRILGALMVTALVFFARDAFATPYNEPWNWSARDSADQARRAAVELVPDDAAVQASPFALPLLAERTEAYVLDTATTVIAAERSLTDSTYVLFDESATDNWSSIWVDNFHRNLVQQGRYTPIYHAAGITLYCRGCPVPA